jgi:predicted peptidase
MNDMKRTWKITAALASLALAGGSLAACGPGDDTAASDTVTASTTSSTTASDSTSTTETETADPADEESPTLESLVAEVAGEFDQVEWTDPETGETLTYNIYLPEDYDESQSYPMVVYIPDSSLVGDDPTAALSQYGALVWASASEQAKHESIVVVPSYPEVILDDHGSYTMTDYVDMTARLVEALKTEYAVDQDRVYGTGQSMGAMTTMYLAAQNPDLYAAEMIVSGQWDVSELSGLADENFVYTAAAGDESASGGQTDVEQMLDDAGIAYSTTTVDATASEQEQDDAATELLAAGDTANFLTFDEGTVLEASDADSSDPMTNSEHMQSFQPAYEITALRDWLFEQGAS